MKIVVPLTRVRSIVGLGGKRNSKAVPPPPPPKKTTSPTAAKEGGPSPLPPLPPPTFPIRDIDQELRDGAESFVGEQEDTMGVQSSANSDPNEVIVAEPTLLNSFGGVRKATGDRATVVVSKEKDAAARFALLSSSIATAQTALDDFDGRTTALAPISLACAPAPCKKVTGNGAAAIASKEVEARARFALLSCSVVSAQKALAAIENEDKLETERVAAEQKREEERRATEIMFINAATVLQSAARRMVARRNYSVLRAATILLQAFARQRRIRVQIHASATRIQALARGVYTRRQVQAEVASIVFLQALARGTIVRNRKRTCDMAIAPIQALVRGRIDRNRVKVIKWYHTNQRPAPKSSNASKPYVSFAPSSPVSIKENPNVRMSGDLINILLDASQGSERAKDRAIAAKKVMIRNTSLYVSYINALISAQIEVDGTLETVLSSSTSIEAIVNELVCFLAMLGQDIRRVLIPSAKIHCAHSVLVENCPRLYVEMCQAMGCRSGFIPMVDEFFHCRLGEDLKAQYELTRTSYAVLFKSKPPVEFWPAPSTSGRNDVGVSFEKLDDNHLFFLNEDNLHDDEDEDDTFSGDYYDEEESIDVSTVHGANVFDMDPAALARELRYLAEEQSIEKVVDELRNVGLKVVGEAMRKASVKKSNQDEESEKGEENVKEGVEADYSVVSAFKSFFD
mmetsp:Transcript_4481/g.12618  ORF Transcript_4481/g.12618 Transcript_4481/m.12618 type:complete len:686 (+) Transcript_4481:172-2229(+)